MRLSKLSISLSILIVLTTLNAEAKIPLWKISGKGLSKPSYIFGASALHSAELLHEVDGLQRVFNSSEVLILESNNTPTDFVSKIRTYGLMKDQRIKNLFTEEDYKKVDKEVRGAITIGLFFLGGVKPAALSMIICSAWQKDVMGGKKEEFLNKTLINNAKKSHKEVIALESVEEQMDMMLNAGTMEEQAEILRRLVNQKQTMLDMYRKGKEAYAKGDFETMGNLGRQFPLPYSLTAAGLDKMIFGRNHKWIKKIEPKMKAKSCLIIINPAQLVFDEGMLSLLRKAGYKVEEIN